MAIEPITRKEQFLAKAGGQQVGDLKPITREEMFLQKIAENGGGSGGGVQPDLSQNDPNAADYVKNRSHYVEIVTEEVFSQSLVLEENNDRTVKVEGYTDLFNKMLLASEPVMNDPTFDPSSILWDVEIDGEVYKSFPSQGGPSDLALVTERGSFKVRYDGVAYIIFSDGAVGKTYDVKIRQRKYKYHPLKLDFLPFYLLDPYADSVNYNELSDAIYSGKFVVLGNYIDGLMSAPMIPEFGPNGEFIFTRVSGANKTLQVSTLYPDGTMSHEEIPITVA